MKPLRVVVAGAGGRMGQEVLQLIARQPDFFQLSGALERTAGPHPIFQLSQLDPQQVDVIVDFSSPEYLDVLLHWCETKQKPLVSGTTGLSPALLQRLSQSTIPILHAPNMSLGVAVLNEMVRLLAALNHYDFAIEEFHHRHKKDAPSGTALHLKETLETAIGKECATASIRGGGIFGVHRVLAMGPEETVTLEHTALNRTVFASGALRAAQWLPHQLPGLYSLIDMMGA